MEKHNDTFVNGRRANEQERGWFELRNHAAFHNDTLTDRIAP
jgi:hypothetical protein